MVVNRRECSAPVTVIDVSRVSICCIASFLGGLLCHVHIVVNWRALLYTTPVPGGVPRRAVVAFGILRQDNL